MPSFEDLTVLACLGSLAQTLAAQPSAQSIAEPCRLSGLGLVKFLGAGLCHEAVLQKSQGGGGVTVSQF